MDRNKTSENHVSLEMSKNSETLRKKSMKRSFHHFMRLAKFIVVKTIWSNVVKYIVIPIITALIAIHYHIDLVPKTLYLSVILYSLSILAITSGYHRFWAHCSFQIDSEYKILPLFFVIFGSSVGIESAKDFRRVHRLHHKYCNTDKDPHNFRKNFLWAHLGWRILRNRKLLKLLQEEPDLEEPPMNEFLEWQDQNNFVFFVLFGFLMPWGIAKYFWNDNYGGLIYAGILRAFLAQQALFSVNSLGHLIGSQPFEDKKTARDSLIVSLITFGEGYNNFHHQFPNDYRNGHYYYRHDPTKWFLNTCYLFSSIFGIKSLHRTNYNLIQRVGLVHQQKLLDRHSAKLDWGVPVNKLPLITVAEFKLLAKSPDHALIMISGVVHDVSPFIHNHPGGVALIKSAIGKDATTVFNGAVYAHSNAANNLLATMRIALIKDENTNSVIRQNRTNKNKFIPSTPLETADAA